MMVSRSRRFMVSLLTTWSFLGPACNCFVIDSTHTMRTATTKDSGTTRTRSSSSALFSSRKDDPAILIQQSRLIRALLNLDDDDTSKKSSNLEKVHFVGRAQLPATTRTDRSMDCAVLATSSSSATYSSQFPCLLLPLPDARHVQLLEFLTGTNHSSKAQPTRLQLLQWNAVLVNRDGGLFDNLPYAEWWVNNNNNAASASAISNHRDAANNPVLSKFHMGKRETYNRLVLGQDWYLDKRKVSGTLTSFSSSSSPLLQRLQQQLTEMIASSKKKKKANNKQNDRSKSSSDIYYDDFDMGSDDETMNDDDAETASLKRRILELQIREYQMDLAELDYRIAVAKAASNNNDDEGSSTKNKETSLQSQRQTCVDQLNAAQERLQELSKGDNDSSRSLSSFLNDITNNNGPEDDDGDQQDIGDGDNNNSDDDEYASPYKMLQEILRRKMKAQVIGAVLENASLLDGTTVLGGAIVLQRIPDQKTVQLAGESVRVTVDDGSDSDDYVPPAGETILVECHADEAVGMALCSSVPLYVEEALFQRASVMMVPTNDDDSNKMWQTVDPELSVLIEGQAGNMSATERVLPVRLPRSTISLYDIVTNNIQQQTSAGNKNLFPTDNPIKSLAEYDTLTNDDKARTLMGLSSFDVARKLPRPRVVRSSPGILDDMLLPLIDESVRMQYRIRDAKQRGDTALLQQLESSKSQRLLAKEKAQQARESGANDNVVAEYESEADFYESLRADITQDEGSYSRFLDRDDWYERTRQQVSKKVDKSKFGNLLDGIE